MSKIEIKLICKKYNNVSILNNISFLINTGDFLTIIGPSGSGKSTLMYILGGLEKQTSGAILIDGVDFNNLSEKQQSKFRCSEIGFVFQFFNLVQNLTVEENVMLPAVMLGEKKKYLNSKVEKILTTVGLFHKRNQYPNELSGGQQQRVAIARALINEPKIILADEPTGNLDSKTGTVIMELLRKINKETNTTIVQVTHDLEKVKYGNRFIKIVDGKVEGMYAKKNT